jgi:hypothetical protein
MGSKLILDNLGSALVFLPCILIIFVLNLAMKIISRISSL